MSKIFTGVYVWNNTTYLSKLIVRYYAHISLGKTMQKPLFTLGVIPVSVSKHKTQILVKAVLAPNLAQLVLAVYLALN